MGLSLGGLGLMIFFIFFPNFCSLRMMYVRFDGVEGDLRHA